MNETNSGATYYYYYKTDVLPISVTIERKIYRCAVCGQRINGNEIDISKVKFCPYCGRKVNSFTNHK